MKEDQQFLKLCEVVDILLGENGCPWDKAQTHQSLRPLLLEESYEVADAIDNKDMAALKEELGDLLLHIVLHSRLAEKENYFSLNEVIAQAAEKLIGRHTHIFGSDSASTPAEVEETWEANKNKEKAIYTTLENIRAVPKALPALVRAQKVIKRSETEFADCHEEIRILLDKLEKTSLEEEKKEICGKIFFFMAVLSEKKQINAEFSLTNAIQEFINTFE